jgi:hypothetical protein
MLLPDDVVEALQTCESAALAAAMIIGAAFPEVLAFAARVRPQFEPPKHAKRRRRSGGQRETIGEVDDKLVAAMKARPGANIGDLAAAIGKSRTSTVSSLHRLRDAELAESRDGVWVLTEPEPVKDIEPWTAPLASRRREHAHA